MMYWLINGSTFVVLVLLCSFTPYLIRKNDVFGVFFPDSEVDLEKVCSMRRNYMLLCLGAGALCAGFWVLTALFAWLNEEISFVIAIVGYLVLEIAVYLWYHRRAKRMKETHEITYTIEQHIAVDMEPPPKLIPAWWYVPHVLLIAITAGITLWREPALENKIPAHWDFAGNVNGYAEKNFFSLYQLIVIELLMLLLFTVLLILTSRSKKVIRTDQPEESKRASFLFKRLWCRYLAIMGFGTLLLLSFVQMVMLGLLPFPWMTPVVVSFTVLVGIGSLALTFYTGQGGSRLIRSKHKSDRIDPREDDRYWKLGCIYYNPDDPSLMVEKRFGVGWTFNMARPAAYLIFAGLLLFVIVSLLFAALSK